MDRLFIPIPARAVRVEATLDVSDGLDMLSSTVLRLLVSRPGPYTVGELADVLCLSSMDLIRSSLAGLEDLGMVGRADEHAELYAAKPRDTSGGPRGDRVVPGWIFVPLVGPRVPLARVWLCEKLSKDRPDDVEHRQNLTGAVNDIEHWRPRRRDLDDQILRIPLRPDVLVAPWPPGNADDSTSVPRLLPLPTLGRHRGPRLHSLRVSRDRGWSKSFVLWAAVDFLPSSQGRPHALYHEPDLFLSDSSQQPEMPLCPDMERWLEEAKLGAVVEAVTEEQRKRARASSLVLRAAGIESEEELADAVRTHCARRVADGVASESALRLTPEVGERLYAAQRWLLLAQRNANYASTCRNAYAHVAERLGRELHLASVPPLNAWIENEGSKPGVDKRLRKNPEVGARLERLGLVEADLRDSYAHLRGVLKRGVQGVRNCTQQPTVGSGLLCLLLPLVLEAEATPHTAALLQMLRTDPQAIERLGRLVAARNNVFHQKDDPMPIDGLDRLVLRTLGTVASGFVHDGERLVPRAGD